MICLAAPLPSLVDQLRAYRVAANQPLTTKGNPIAAASAGQITTTNLWSEP